MHVNAISFTGSGSKYRKSEFKNAFSEKTNKEEIGNDYRPKVSNSSIRNATKGMIIGMLMLPAASTVMSSCDADAEAYAYADCDCCHGRDTVIVSDKDTIKIKEDFKSPVIDSINAILDDLDIDHGEGYIPLKISFIDEMDTRYRKYLFDGDASAPDQVVYRGKRSPFDDNSGQFIIGTPLDESENYLASLTNDGKLYLMKMIPKPGVTDPKGMDDFMVAPQSFILDREKASKVIRKLGISNTQGGREDLGIMEKGEMPKSIKLTNPYGTTWRYTNIDVESADAPKSSKY